MESDATKEKIAVFGAGSWGTALSISLAGAKHDVTLWARRSEMVEYLRKERVNQSYLPEVQLPEEVHLTADLEEAGQGKDLWVFAIPSQSVRAVASKLAPHADERLVLVSVAKGIENDTLKTSTQVLDELVPPVPSQRIGVLYGPSHAEEVGQLLPTTVVAAAPARSVAEYLQSVFMTPRLRVYVNTDVIGVEIAGSVKNVMAIAAGISDGVGFGDNTKAAIVTRGLSEIKRLGVAMGAKPSTFAGLAGIGDLVVTCMSGHSRNRYLGEQVGKGRTLEEVEREMSMVAEGVRTTISVRALARRHGVEMPITEAVYSVLFDGKSPHEAVYDLMNRSAKHEDWLE